MTPSSLRTKWLTLRAPVAQDAKIIAQALNNLNVSRWLSAVPFPYLLGDAEWFIAENIVGRMNARLIWDGDSFVGTIGIDGELGYWLAEAAWCKGYATEAGQAVVDDFFTKTDANDLRSNYFDGNAGSSNVLTKLGFVSSGGDTGYCAARTCDVPRHRVTLTRARWAAPRGSPE